MLATHTPSPSPTPTRETSGVSARQQSPSPSGSRASSLYVQGEDNVPPEEVEPAVPARPPQHSNDCHRFCLAITKSTLVGGFVGGAVGGAVMGIPGAILFAVGGAWSGGLLGTCLEFACAPLGAERTGHAGQLEFEIV